MLLQREHARLGDSGKSDAQHNGGMESAAEWDRRLGWSRELVADDVGRRERALGRLAVARGRRDRALRELNAAWREKGLSGAKEEQARYAEARREVFPDALWDFVPGGVESGGLRYALLYLNWEARYPAEWTAAAKSWATKKALLWKLARAVPELSDAVIGELVELIRYAVCREHRCEDVGYALLARAVGEDRLRPVLAGLADDPVDTYRLRARYLLCLLDHPESPRPKAGQWRAWSAGE